MRKGKGMKRKNVLSSVGVIVLLGWICLSYFACEWTPERDNPLDPNSELYQPPSLGSITGEVRNLSGTSSLSGVMVSLESDSQDVVTASNGKYLIENVADGPHWVSVHKEGYADSSAQVTVVTGQTSIADFRLNALPRFDSVSVTLHRIRVVPSPDEFVTISARIIDIDMNISTLLVDTAVLAVFEGDTIGNLNYSNTQITGTFTFDRDFPIAELPISSSQDIIGRPFILTVIDQVGGFSISDPYSIARWLDIPNPISPIEITVGPNPTLVWDQYIVGFSYIQNIRVFDNIEILRWDSLSVSPGVVQVTVTDTLETTNETYPKYYYWTIEIVDLFGNTARSMNTKFYVQ